MKCLYLAPTGLLSVVDDARLDHTTERHKIELNPQPHAVQEHPVKALRDDPALQGFIIEMYKGWPGRDRLMFARLALSQERRVWLYWPDERAIECLDRERLRSAWRHWLFITGYRVWTRSKAPVGRLGALMRRRAASVRQAGHSVADRLRAFIRTTRTSGIRAAVRATTTAVQHMVQVDSAPASTSELRVKSSSERLVKLDALIARAQPVPFPTQPQPPAREHPVAGTGAYLRTDFWARIESGGSYGHTCYVAKELAAVTAGFVCFMAHRYKLLDAYGLRQVVLDPPSATASEEDIVHATEHYYRLLKPAFEAVRPAYIYERICLGNYVGALLSRELSIPYIVEYNGSEISMRRSFDGAGYIYEYEYIKAEALAFKQATMISVISKEVQATLIARGVPADKILVNPNGADPAAYAPATTDEKRELRAELGLPSDGPVIGFTGTFGGWHGIDVLAAAIPRICALAPSARFVLIGDGNYKHLVDQEVARSGLQHRVRAVGRVPQAEGARLLKACDIYVSPHNSHMVDSKFFGSPTKIFEYMAMGGGIVASDLEQIGESLSPALSPADLREPEIVVGDERAVLCTPGDVDEFVDAVVGLTKLPDLCLALGRNARQAVEDHYSWARHVSHLWRFMAGERASERFASDLQRKSRPRRQAAALEMAPMATSAGGGGGGGRTLREPQIDTGDRYKDEVQRQWDNDPAGSHYVKAATPHTLEWFTEAERYRHGEYAPWMHETMEFAQHAGKDVLEIGGGMGTDLVQFAKHGARVTDVDLSSGHLELAEENFRLRGLSGRFVHHDAETLPFDAASFDVVYSNGVLHHTPNTRQVVSEIRRVLRPGGKAIVMMYAENSLHYWRNLVLAIGLKQQQLETLSMGEIMSRSVERSDNAAARPLVKVYTPSRLEALFEGFERREVVQRQMVAAEVPRVLTWMPLPTLGRMMGWNVIIKAYKPASTR